LVATRVSRAHASSTPMGRPLSDAAEVLKSRTNKPVLSGLRLGCDGLFNLYTRTVSYQDNCDWLCIRRMNRHESTALAHTSEGVYTTLGAQRAVTR
jgi:hypothetical protein